MTPATRARMKAGYTLEGAAARARISPAYLRRVEREGASFILAERLSRLYQCPMEYFLGGGTSGKEATPARRCRDRQRATTRRSGAAQDAR